ncbi:histidine kinase [Novosphingobium sp. AAP83]|nr:histidine kinase [Novosphingobium sp. AAP83]
MARLVQFGLPTIAFGTFALFILHLFFPGESWSVHLAAFIGLCLLVSGGGIALHHRSADPQIALQLARDLEAAQSASAAKSRYLANISHEIRSPLNAIYGYAQLIEQEASVDPKDAARVIRRSAEHLTNLVEGLLDIASVEQGVVRIDSAVVRLAPLVEQVAEMFRPQAEQKGLSFRCELPDRLPEFVRMDTRRVRQVLINLVSNAVKFTDHGEVVLALDWSGQTATFEVRDTGPGIREAQHEQVFAPYERSGDTAHGGNSGAGLGLAISRAIVQMLGGDLQVASVAGQGSSFKLRLLMPPVSGFVESKAGAVLRPTGYTGKRRSLLLVDDNPDHLSLLRNALGELGFDISYATDGHTALAMAERDQFDAVILDVSMPGISGWETAAHMRAVHGRSISILMLSANADERHGLGGQAPDHDHFLLKPIDLSVLIDVLGRLLTVNWTWPKQAPCIGHVSTPEPITLSETARAHIEQLKSLVRIGHVRAMEDEIRNLERAAPDAAPLVAKLYDCLDRFDLTGLGRTLEDL